MQDDGKREKESKGRKIARIILIIIAVLMIIFGGVYFGINMYSQYVGQQDNEELSSIAEATTKAEKKVKNPIDFKSLQKKNDEIYAWIKVPDTKIDLPIVQSTVDDAFYLNHGALDKKWSVNGAIYTESLNSTTFEDRVTVLYGHNMNNKSMFAHLHNFEKKDFFDKHPYYYIYTPDSKLTYQVVSAFKYDDRHILNCFDFQNKAVFESFLQTIQNPESTSKNVRTDLDTEITADSSKITILSTCCGRQRSNRYLVCGVLVKNEKTN